MSDTKKKVIVISTVVFIVAFIGVGIWLTTRGRDNTKVNNTKVNEISSTYKMNGNSLEDFDLSFLKLENPKSNMIYSPLSIKYALAMLSEGANGNTKAQIDSVIGNYKAKIYPNNSNMSFANAMFIRNTYQSKIKDNYKDTLLRKYNAEVMYDNFSSADNVNSWVKEKTFGLVDNLMDDVSSLDYLLINALAIDMNWKNLIQSTMTSGNIYSVNFDHEEYSAYISPIEDDNYESLKFNDNINAKAVEIGATINNYDIVNTLGRDNIYKEIKAKYEEWLKDEYNYEYAKSLNELDVDIYVNKFIDELDANYKKVIDSTDFSIYYDNEVKAFSKELKEYDGTTLEYIGIMPEDINSFVENMNANSINNIISKLKDIKLENFEEGKVTKITGYIPLFKFDYKLNLVNDLNKLGITDVFDKEKSDLSNLTSDKSYINSAVHKANIEFSNEGIKAAAATGVGGLGDAWDGFDYLYKVPVVNIDMTFDKPYIFLIRDKDSGEVWFVGQVYEPIENEN